MIRRHRSFALSLVLLGTLWAIHPTGAQTPLPGRRCLGSESAIKDNLPLGTSAHSTEITAIRGIVAGTPRKLLGWYYTNREGTHYVQSQLPNELGDLLSRAGDRELARRVRAGSASEYFALTSATAASLRRLGSDRGLVFAACYGTGRTF